MITQPATSSTFKTGGQGQRQGQGLGLFSPPPQDFDLQAAAMVLGGLWDAGTSGAGGRGMGAPEDHPPTDTGDALALALLGSTAMQYSSTVQRYSITPAVEVMTVGQPQSNELASNTSAAAASNFKVRVRKSS